MAYVKEEIKPIVRNVPPESSDLASISLEIGLGKETKTCFNIFYREFTGGVSGLGNLQAQKDRLSRQISHWKSLYGRGKDVVILGDSNLCAMQWDEVSYINKELANMIQDFMLEQSSQQLVNSITRIESAGQMVQRSCIDHCYTDVREKVTGPFVEAVGDSDHFGIRILKYCRTPIIQPQAIKRRSYKNFSVEAFLTDIYHSNINEGVTTHESIESAAEAFRNEFQAILNYHAPIKTVQIRKNYCKYLTQETKLLIQERNTLKKEASKKGDKGRLKKKNVKFGLLAEPLLTPSPPPNLGPVIRSIFFIVLFKSTPFKT